MKKDIEHRRELAAQADRFEATIKALKLELVEAKAAVDKQNKALNEALADKAKAEIALAQSRNALRVKSQRLSKLKRK